MSIKNQKIEVYEMTCTSCEKRVERAVKALKGVLNAEASYSEQFIKVKYENEECTLEEIKESIKNAGYSTESSKDYKFIGIIIIVLAIVLLGAKTSGFDMEEKLSNASYAILFVVGILTSLHCVGMCGGIMLSQTLTINSGNKFQSIKPSLLYNLGRVVSYTILGGIVGALGSVFSLSIMAKSALQIFAGVFMIIMGLNMSGFKLFRKFNITLPFSFCKSKKKSSSPFVVGLLNGFMPCGPLQTMQLFALGTGSALKGALSMFAFSIGTVPLMLAFGVLSGLLSKGYTKKILKFSGILIIVLGLIMGNRGLALAGINISPFQAISNTVSAFTGGGTGNSSNSNVVKATLQDGVQVIEMTANNNGYTPNAFYVQKGIPIKWIINGESLNSCNNAIVIPSQNIEMKINKGTNIVEEFTPTDKDINFSCWMGMIRGVIKVVDDLDSVDTSINDPSIPPASTGPSCCAVPIDEDSETSNSTSSSIYGSDISLVPTEKLVRKAITSEGTQSAEFKGIGYELEPLIVVSNTDIKSNLTFDLTDFDNAEGQYQIIDVDTGDTISSFNGQKGKNTVEFYTKKLGTYAILKDNSVLAVIETVNDIKSVDLEEIRKKYLN